MTRTIQTQSDHDWMVSQVADHFVRLGHTGIQADHISHPNGRPAQIGDHIPDVTARHVQTGRPVICEVETGDTMEDTHTYNQLATFRQLADRLGGTLHVALPFQHDIAPAQAVTNRWGILVDQWWFGQNS